MKWLFATALIFVFVLGGFKLFHKKEVPVTPPIEKKVEVAETHKVIGISVEGRNIESYSYGSGPTHIVFVGGIHGGYEWNSVLLAYTYMDYLSAHLDTIPSNLTIDVIPSANPDGVFKVSQKEGRFVAEDVATNTSVLASGRFNANMVDLNRNFDCKWQPKSVWQSKTVSGGSKAFSEPEANAIKNFMLETSPVAVIFWHSQANAVYASQCGKGILPETLALMNTYSAASGYKAAKTFDAYTTTGAADDWLASVNIPAITVELSTHTAIEWDRNLAGIQAVINSYKKE